MMRNFCVLIFTTFFLAACNTVPELSRSEAVQLINGANKFPKDYGFTIFLDDHLHMDRIRATDLQSQGLISVVPEGESKQRGEHFITLTEQGSRYLMKETLPEGQQMVRVVTAYLNEESPDKLRYLRQPTKNTLEVEYEVNYKDLTPFAVLLRKNYREPEKAKAYFRYQQGNWSVEMEPGPEFSTVR